MAEGTPESKGGNPRKDADDAYATFMEMSDNEILNAAISSSAGLFFEPAERAGFERAVVERKRRRERGRV